MSVNDSVQQETEPGEIKDVSENITSAGTEEISTESTNSQPNLEKEKDASEDTVVIETQEVNISSENVISNVENAITKDDSVNEAPGSVPYSISVKFNDDVVAGMYKEKFLKFLSCFKELKVSTVGNLLIEIHRDENVDETEFIGDSDYSMTPSSAKKRKKHNKAKKELFIVDATPSESVQHDLRYTTKFVIDTDNFVKKESDIEEGSKSNCFNCGESHLLKLCPLPKDYTKIYAARQKFKKTSRYHVDQEQKYKHLQPGKISQELRKALGLQKDEIPHYVYLMRKLGYPPGWLEEAKFVNSDLNIFDIDGNYVKDTAIKKRGLDESKIVEYPGFNVPLHKGTKDEYRRFRVPPYSENFNKSVMISFFDKRILQEEDNLETCDMDIDHDPDCSDLSQEQETEIKRNNRNSPSLIDLEQQKQQLLEELNDEPKNFVDIEKEFLTVKTTCFGTPLLKSTSPYSTLPKPDNFSKDVSPVLYFENLPNSTGKYEQLTDVLKKVRSTVQKCRDS